ncbi:MAG: peptide MFS transporter [Novosphingobium sp.]|nr:peptide MFS transporter [Novosphingobium sp.]
MTATASPGHPRGLYYLALTEIWERFSFYGMRALLVLYMVQQLLLPGRIENVAGMAVYRSALESVLGPMSTQVLATQTFGFYAGLVYLTPLIGGWMADRWIGVRKTVMSGIALMTAGHIAMVFDASFLLALLLLILGSGCLKGNIAAQVGHLYPEHEEARRSHGFTIFSTGINIGAVLGPLVCGLIAQVYGWHAGFGLAGGMMIVAALVYLAGLRHFTPEQPIAEKAARARLTRDEWRITWLVIGVLLLSTLQFLAYDQLANSGMIWMDSHADLDTRFGTVPVAWFVSIDAMSSILSVPLLLWFYNRQAAKGREPDDFGKIMLGGVLLASANIVLAIGDWAAGDGKAPIIVPVFAAICSGAGFIAAWPTMLALVSRRAPASINAVMMAGVYLTAFASGIASGFVSRLYEVMDGSQFWLLNACFPLAGVLALLVTRRWFKSRMDAHEAHTAQQAGAHGEVEVQQ